ncbi:MAG: DUF1772 domain-containing protein [Reyranellaceae bacterium]
MPALATVLAVALAASILLLGAALAHAFELPNKIGLDRDAYFLVQQIYRGWDGFAAILAVQVAALATAAGLARRDASILRPLLLTLLCVGSAQALFWTFTFPANVATANWTVAPADWQRLRLAWEYSHLAGALLQLSGLLALVLAIAQAARRDARGPRR